MLQNIIASFVDLFQRLFRQDLLVASLFRNFLLAERILRSYDCTPVSCPKLPPTYQVNFTQKLCSLNQDKSVLLYIPFVCIFLASYVASLGHGTRFMLGAVANSSGKRGSLRTLVVLRGSAHGVSSMAHLRIAKS